jgi:hypothetical protein
MKPVTRPAARKTAPVPLARLYRLVYGALLAGVGLYLLLILKGAGGTTLTVLAVWLLVTGGMLLSPDRCRARLVPRLFYGSQPAALALWLSLPFIGLSLRLLTTPQERELAIGGFAAGGVLLLICIILRQRAA